jgi:hypothetical protein
MMNAACQEQIQAIPCWELERLAAHVQGCLGRRIQDLRLFMRDDGLVLQGRVSTYYAKQLAQHALMRATKRPIQANEIEVV